MSWDDDKPIPEDEAIKAVHPCRSGRHDLFQEAQRMVGAKRSKYALVELVTWLLFRIDELTKQVAELQKGNAWVWNDGDRVNVVNWEFAPIADTLELDRAVQFAIAIAFGQLVALLADGMNCGECCGGSCRASQQALAMDFGRIVRTAMGGRIPDEVP
jgi:hypothetical protein